jgi:hypothetical protein
MNLNELHFGQRVRVNVPGIGDHGQVGTVRKVLGNKCYVHLDWNERRHHRVWFYAADLEHVSSESAPAPQV